MKNIVKLRKIPLKHNTTIMLAIVAPVANAAAVLLAATSE
jgi:hypothetical protein